MVRRFEFRNPVMQLDIAGHRFDVDMAADIAAKMAAFAEAAQEAAKETQDDASGAHSAWALCAQTIDGVLGEGACETIFADRAHMLYDIYDVIRFITASVSDFAIQGE